MTTEKGCAKRHVYTNLFYTRIALIKDSESGQLPDQTLSLEILKAGRESLLATPGSLGNYVFYEHDSALNSNYSFTTFKEMSGPCELLKREFPKCTHH
ncbi:hypothetical protein Lmac_0232 [Legionella maceachernii]|uniref:Uncharacterized protein n=1 Tax=Legionella maceachernii TaxID=466 RepID=A0A0W0WGL6_9GAMM|nr:hypothetical protein Lmac_0232 [Legionella maceachernii]SJZ94602.1 hypothetical protein SAMN02745128_01541 [Legionella maceachernii]SUP03363.1 Uncharacterised protein [Legionella maceachernii]